MTFVLPFSHTGVGESGASERSARVQSCGGERGRPAEDRSPEALSLLPPLSHPLMTEWHE